MKEEQNLIKHQIILVFNYYFDTIEIDGEQISLTDEEYKAVRKIVDDCKSKSDPFARDPDSVFYMINQLGQVDYIVDYFGSNDAENTMNAQIIAMKRS